MYCLTYSPCYQMLTFALCSSDTEESCSGVAGLWDFCKGAGPRCGSGEPGLSEPLYEY